MREEKRSLPALSYVLQSWWLCPNFGDPSFPHQTQGFWSLSNMWFRTLEPDMRLLVLLHKMTSAVRGWSFHIFAKSLLWPVQHLVYQKPYLVAFEPNASPAATYANGGAFQGPERFGFLYDQRTYRGVWQDKKAPVLTSLFVRSQELLPYLPQGQAPEKSLVS